MLWPETDAAFVSSGDGPADRGGGPVVFIAAA
jgi:hypothetical protein